MNVEKLIEVLKTLPRHMRVVVFIPGTGDVHIRGVTSRGQISTYPPQNECACGATAAPDPSWHATSCPAYQLVPKKGKIQDGR